MSTFTAMRMTRYGLGVALALVVVHAPAVAAQGKQPGARMERIADGVYAIIHDAADEQFPSGNTGVVIGDDGVLVVDATYLPSHAKADIALIRSVTDKPIRDLVITHLHRDHNGGASAYRDAFPGVAMVSGAQTRDFIAINRAATAKSAAANGSPLRTALAALEARLGASIDSAGQALTASAKADVEHRIAQRRAELDELSTLRVIIPDVAVKNELDLFLGSRHMQVKNRGRANSPDDVTVSLPLDQIQQSVGATRLRAGSPAWSGSALDDDWKTTVRALVERAWHELRGLD